MIENTSDNRKENERFPNVNLPSFITKNWKDLLALFLLLFAIAMWILIASSSLGVEKELRSDLILMFKSITFSSLGFLWGRR